MSGRDLYTGTLDTLILKAVANGAQHGYGIGLWLRNNSRQIFDVKEGVLYPALHRLEGKGLLSAEWGPSATGRRAKFYSLTPVGDRALTEESERLTRQSQAVLDILKATP